MGCRIACRYCFLRLCACGGVRIACRLRLFLFRSVERVRRGRDRFRADDKRRCRRRLKAEQIAKLRVRGFVVMPALQRKAISPSPNAVAPSRANLRTNSARSEPARLYSNDSRVPPTALRAIGTSAETGYIPSSRQDVVHAAVAAHDGDKFRMLAVSKECAVTEMRSVSPSFASCFAFKMHCVLALAGANAASPNLLASTSASSPV